MSRFFRKKGCLISIVVLIAAFIWTIRQLGEPDRRARRVHGAINASMTYADVPALLTGRHYCFFQVKTNEQWKSLSQREFADLVTNVSSAVATPMRLQLHFMGMSPRRVSFCVDIGPAGIVTNVTDPYGWD